MGSVDLSVVTLYSCVLMCAIQFIRQIHTQVYLLSVHSEYVYNCVVWDDSVWWAKGLLLIPTVKLYNLFLFLLSSMFLRVKYDHYSVFFLFLFIRCEVKLNIFRLVIFLQNSINFRSFFFTFLFFVSMLNY